MGLLKKVNEKYFDKESKAMWYVLGAFYSCYIPVANHGIIFRSSHKDLVQIVKDQLESEHDITSDPRNISSHWIQMSSVPYLNSRLKKMGLNVPKTKRRFPKNIHKKYISHFVRGFLDDRGGVYILSDKYTHVRIRFDNSFLVSLHQVLVKYAKVQRGKPSGDLSRYAHKDSLKIYDFIYQEEYGLYLPSKKELFITDYPADRSTHSFKIAVSRRIDEAKGLLLQGTPIKKVAQQLGYSYTYNLHRAFKSETGQTIPQWLKENR